MATLDALSYPRVSIARASRSPVAPGASLALAARFALAFGVMAIVAMALFAHGACRLVTSLVSEHARRHGFGRVSAVR